MNTANIQFLAEGNISFTKSNRFLLDVAITPVYFETRKRHVTTQGGQNADFKI
jgi:hypothetical protein